MTDIISMKYSPFQAAHSSYLSTLFLTSLLSLVGCGGSDTPPLGTVQGIIKLDNVPLSDASVTFQPADGTRMSVGQTDASGAYNLKYNLDTNGALVGQHKVIITTEHSAISNEVTGEKKPAVQEKLPAKYNQETELKAEVKKGSNTLDFNLESAENPSVKKP
jgi:hypothetical protein